MLVRRQRVVAAPQKRGPAPGPHIPSSQAAMGSTHNPHPDPAGGCRSGCSPCTPLRLGAGPPRTQQEPQGLFSPHHGMAPGTTDFSHLSLQRGGHRRPGCAHHHPAAQDGIATRRRGSRPSWRGYSPPFPASPRQRARGGGERSFGTSRDTQLGVQSCPPPPATPFSAETPPHALTAAEPPLPDGAGATPHRREPEPTAGRASRRSLL